MTSSQSPVHSSNLFFPIAKALQFSHHMKVKPLQKMDGQWIDAEL